MPPVSKQMPLPTSAIPVALCACALRLVGEAHDPRATVRVGAGDGQERTGTHFFELADAVELERPALAARELLQCCAIGNRVEHVGRQGCEPAREVVADCDGAAAVVKRGCPIRDVDVRQVARNGGLRFLLRHRRRVSQHGAQQGFERGRALTGRSEFVCMQMQARDARLEHFVRQLASQFEPLETGGAGLHEANHDERPAAIGQPRRENRRFLAAALMRLQQFSPHGRLWQRVDGFVRPGRLFEQDDRAIGTRQRGVRQRERLRRDVDFQLGRNHFLHGENLDRDRPGPDHCRAHSACSARADFARSGAAAC